MDDARPLILVVDDERAISDIVAHVLVEEGYRAEVASDGGGALEVMSREPPAVVVLDLMMPRVDGWTVIDRMANHVRLSRTPVIVLTGAQDARVRAQNVAAVLRKPVTLDALVQRVGDVVAGRRRFAPAAPPRPRRAEG